MIERSVPVPGEQGNYNLVIMGEFEFASPIEKIEEA